MATLFAEAWNGMKHVPLIDWDRGKLRSRCRRTGQSSGSLCDRREYVKLKESRRRRFCSMASKQQPESGPYRGLLKITTCEKSVYFIRFHSPRATQRRGSIRPPGPSLHFSHDLHLIPSSRTRLGSARVTLGRWPRARASSVTPPLAPVLRCARGLTASDTSGLNLTDFLILKATRDPDSATSLMFVPGFLRFLRTPKQEQSFRERRLYMLSLAPQIARRRSQTKPLASPSEEWRMVTNMFIHFYIFPLGLTKKGKGKLGYLLSFFYPASGAKRIPQQRGGKATRCEKRGQDISSIPPGKVTWFVTKCAKMAPPNIDLLLHSEQPKKKSVQDRYADRPWRLCRPGPGGCLQ